MTEHTTETGNRLCGFLQSVHESGETLNDEDARTIHADIRAIEQEARADLAARLEALPDGLCDLTGGARHFDLIERRAVLAAIKEAEHAG